MSVLGTDKRDSSFHARKNPQDSEESAQAVPERDVSACVPVETRTPTTRIVPCEVGSWEICGGSNREGNSTFVHCNYIKVINTHAKGNSFDLSLD